MSDTDPTRESPKQGEGHADEAPTMVSSPLASSPGAPGDPAGEPFDAAADEDDEWLSTGPSRGIRLAVPVA
jgi:hypothetical protein